eukprot:SAG11_NODE_1474_length_4839_cov_2.761603_3_plen_398_part_00
MTIQIEINYVYILNNRNLTRALVAGILRRKADDGSLLDIVTDLSQLEYEEIPMVTDLTSVRCSQIQDLEDGHIACAMGVRYGSECVSTCDLGYILQGPQSVICESNSEWSDDVTSLQCLPSPGAASDVYTRWGADVCADQHDLIYVGRAVGAKDDDSGTGSNFLCMPVPPKQSYSSTSAHAGSSKLFSLEYEMSSYSNVAGFEAIVDLDAFEMPCAVCARRFASGFTQWGSDTCPGGTEFAYGGYVYTSVGRGATFECLEKKETVVARQACTPLTACPPNGGPMTAFNFDTSEYEFQGGSVGGKTTITLPLITDCCLWLVLICLDLVSSGTDGSGWSWSASAGSRAGVIERTADATEPASIYTDCHFVRNEVTIRLDLLPRRSEFLPLCRESNISAV